MKIVLLAAALAAAFASPALARNDWPSRQRGAADPPEGYQPRLSAEAGVLCVKQCPADTLPCDPPSFKIADGRCTTQWR